MKRISIKRIIAMTLSLCLVATCFVGCSKSEVETVKTVSAYDENSADYGLKIDASNEIHNISDLLYGIFFEDINFSADGGLYAEMIANRSFEFTEIAENDQMYHWNTVGKATANVQINDVDNALNENNTNYLFLTNEAKKSAGVENTGFLDGIAVEQGKNYKVSFYAKAVDGYNSGISVCIAEKGKALAKGNIDNITDSWQKYELTLTPKNTANENVTLQLLIDKGTVALDMISLFPEDTYKNRENGLRLDLATKLEELSPKFLRFPGGCVIEGFNRDSAYSWKDSVGVGANGAPLEFNGKYGDVATRKQGINVWTDMKATDDAWPSFMTYGLGFYEYFQFAEDIGAVGVPVLNAGMYCQGREGIALDINSDEFKAYVQDMLDLVEFCRGDENTVWGKVRVDLGHTEPFELKYICIGNENWGEDYYVRYNEFLKAFNSAKESLPEMYDGIELIYSAGPDDGTSGADYLASYEYAKNNSPDKDDVNSFAGAIDQHYYNEPEWFLRHADYYDEENYSRDTQSMTDKRFGGGINVFLGEYASWSNTMYSALAEAAYMTGLERNGDIVRMSTYAPLFSSTVARHWAPNLIWFNNNSSVGSANYYVQKLFSQNAGTKLLDSNLTGASRIDKSTTGKVGVGTWNTSAQFDNVKITNNETGEVIAEDDFSNKSTLKKNWEKVTNGKFSIKDGALCQTDIEPEYNDLGAVMYFGDSSWSDYTYTLDATKIDGDEGFIIPFAVEDSTTNYFWNIGGWHNTVSCLQRVHKGSKTGQLEGTVKDFVAETGVTYHLKIVVSGNNFKCYINDELYVDFNAVEPAFAEAYQVVSTDETGDVIIKLVNVCNSSKTFAVNIDGMKNTNANAKAYQVSANEYNDENILGEELKCDMKELDLGDLSNSFNYTVPKYSAIVIRIPNK